jgi:uncharacterized cupin superfamily protein
VLPLSNRPTTSSGAPTTCQSLQDGKDVNRFVNRSAADALLLVVGDRTPGDEASYADIDPHGRMGADGKYAFVRKDGTPSGPRKRRAHDDPSRTARTRKPTEG